jgi:hypothetical protein
MPGIACSIVSKVAGKTIRTQTLQRSLQKTARTIHHLLNPDFFYEAGFAKYPAK